MGDKKTNVLRLANTILKKVQKEKLFNSQNHLLITFSGGQDSALCLLVLFILRKKTKFVLNRKKVLDFSREIQNTGHVTPTLQKCLQKKKINDSLCSKSKIAYHHLTHLPVTNDTLLWCNHLWQKGAFFTMEHVSKLVLCKGYAMFFFSPVQAVVSEKDARHWRHKVMQRSSLFLEPRQKDCAYHSIELYYNLVSMIYSKNVTKVKKAHAGILLYQNKGMSKHCLYKQTHTFVEFTYLQKYVSQQFCLYTMSPQDVPFQSPKNRMNVMRAKTELMRVMRACQTKFGTRSFASQFASARKAKLMQKLRFCNCTHNFFLHTKAQQLPPQWAKQGNALNAVPRPELLCVQGHTKSDRAESILFNIIKGTGMNGISTLQYKHTFLSNSNTLFYPIVFDFFETLQIVCLQSYMFKQKKRVKINRTSLAMMTVLKQNFVLLRFFNTTSFGKNSVIFKMKSYSNKLESNIFNKHFHVKTLYYQLKYKMGH